MKDEYGSNLTTTSAWAGLLYWAARDNGDEYLSWPEGNGYIARKLIEPISEKISRNALVYKINSETPESKIEVLITLRNFSKFSFD